MFRKYEKTYRIVVPEIDVRGKFFLSDKETKELLAGEVVVEEKMDGANVGIIRHKRGFHLQKRGSLMATGEHEQFGFFYNWAYRQNYEKIMEIPMHHIIYGELLYAVHSLYYDQLPDYFLAFDVWTGQRWMGYDERNELCQKLGFHQVPFIARDSFGVSDLHMLISDKSAYGEKSEGIVVKRYRKNDYLRGKIVKAEFIKHLEEDDHWMNKIVKRNKLALDVKGNETPVF